MAQFTDADHINQFDKVYQVVQNSEAERQQKRGDRSPKRKANAKPSNTIENQA